MDIHLRKLTFVFWSTEDSTRITPHSEEFQTVIWHCLVSHPKLQKNETKW